MSLKCIFFLMFSCISISLWAEKPFTIMLDPAGDSHYAGREIEDYFERGITLQFAEQLKRNLEYILTKVRVILTRFPGEAINPLQNASFANQLEVDLYISIHLFPQKKGPNEISFYYFCTHPITDYWERKTSELCFIDVHSVHQNSITTSQKWAKEFVSVFTKNYNDYFKLHTPLGLPFKPLCGIQAPAIAFEAGLLNPQDWQRYIKPLSEGIEKVVTNAKKRGETSRVSLF